MASTSAPPSTFNVDVNGAKVPVFGVSSLSDADIANAIASVPFRDWITAMDPKILFTSITVQSIDYFGPRVGFVKVIADCTLNGQKVPGIVFLRGGAVAVLLILVCEMTKEEYVVCVKQPRLAASDAAFLEMPAGMLDGSGHFSGVAAKELAEETGISLGPEDLTDLTQLAYGGDGTPAAAPVAGATGGAGTESVTTTTAAKAATELTATAAVTSGGASAHASAAVGIVPPRSRRGMYPSVGACDEFCRILYARRCVSAAELASIQGRITGCAEENEAITVELVPLAHVWRLCTDAVTIASMALRDKLLAAGMLTA